MLEHHTCLHECSALTIKKETRCVIFLREKLLMPGIAVCNFGGAPTGRTDVTKKSNMQIFVEKTLFFVQGGEIGQPLPIINNNL